MDEAASSYARLHFRPRHPAETEILICQTDGGCTRNTLTQDKTYLIEKGKQGGDINGFQSVKYAEVLEPTPVVVSDLLRPWPVVYLVFHAMRKAGWSES
jgi:hypothetical protein